MKKQKSDWIDLPTKKLLINGLYIFKLRHPISKIETEVEHLVTNGLHGFAYAYKCKLIKNIYR